MANSPKSAVEVFESNMPTELQLMILNPALVLYRNYMKKMQYSTMDRPIFANPIPPMLTAMPGLKKEVTYQIEKYEQMGERTVFDFARYTGAAREVSVALEKLFRNRPSLKRMEIWHFEDLRALERDLITPYIGQELENKRVLSIHVRDAKGSHKTGHAYKAFSRLELLARQYLAGKGIVLVLWFLKPDMITNLGDPAFLSITALRGFRHVVVSCRRRWLPANIRHAIKTHPCFQPSTPFKLLANGDDFENMPALRRALRQAEEQHEAEKTLATNKENWRYQETPKTDEPEKERRARFEGRTARKLRKLRGEYDFNVRNLIRRYYVRGVKQREKREWLEARRGVPVATRFFRKCKDR